MTSQTNFIPPPRIAAWLLDLFSPSEEAEVILGDLLEEYSHLASASGVAFAQRWYWRQTLNTIAHLVYASFRRAPLSTIAAVVGGFLLRRLVAGLPERAIFAVLERYQVFDHHFRAYVFFASTGIDIAHWVVFLLVGCVVAWGAKGREMAATTTLGLIFGAMAVAAAVAILTRTGDAALLWRLTWSSADSFAIVVGGALVRMLRSKRSDRSNRAHLPA
jgi:hypothetical protein